MRIKSLCAVACLLLCATLSMASVTQYRGTSPLVVNVALTANIESCYTAVTDLHGFEVKLRGANPLKIAFVTGGTGTTYLTVPSGVIWSADNSYFRTASVLCFQCTANDTVELVVWR